MSRVAAITRCAWPKNDLATRYHDEEWGVPQRDDRVLFEFLILEGAQAGLSWDTILAKRDRYRTVFAGFDPETVARFTPARLEKLLQDPGIVRNRLKVFGAVTNAKAFLEVQDEKSSFADYLWSFVDGRPIVNRWTKHTQVPARTPLSDRLSKDLKKRGFTFVGTTICYAYMQAVGIVNDHATTCFRHTQLSRPKSAI